MRKGRIRKRLRIGRRGENNSKAQPCNKNVKQAGIKKTNEIINTTPKTLGI